MPGIIRQVGLAAVVLALAGCQSMPKMPAIGSAKASCHGIKPGSGPFIPPFPSACPDVQTSASGIQWIELVAGPEGKGSPEADATVIVAYEGYLAADGTRIDSSYARGEPAVFNIEDVIQGWTETLKRMSTGDEWVVFIPYQLAYGAAGRGDAIPPRSDLVFKIRLDGFLNPDEMEDANSKPASAGATGAFWNEFLPWDASREGVVRLKSGLSYFVIDAGDQSAGKVYAKDTVAIDYEARLEDTGAVIGSTWQQDQPLVVKAGDMIPGFAQMISLMKPGAVWIGRVPSAIGYGKEGVDGIIPPNADLIYLVNLIAVNPR
ncbi:FKBP-type peptidyl-prolyl cis-trans isomerase [Henriciella sp. AS95]|uniref:FKBP-type peptidyl-prolyl cis-trans isomerase n=1 Tax=Henriciella sp. AS95 TaxID=3135782 RepID=UPI00316D0441